MKFFAEKKGGPMVSREAVLEALELIRADEELRAEFALFGRDVDLLKEMVESLARNDAVRYRFVQFLRLILVQEPEFIETLMDEMEERTRVREQK